MHAHALDRPNQDNTEGYLRSGLITHSRIKLFSRDFYQLLALMVLSFAISYYLPKLVSQLYFLGTLVLFFRSNKSYFWVVFFLVLYSAPFGLFAESQKTIQTGIPLFTLLPGISLNYYQLFTIVALFKALQKKAAYTYYFGNNLKVLFIYFGLLLILALVFHRASPMTILFDVRGTLYYTFLFSLPRLIRTRDSFFKFLYLIVPFVLFHFIDSVYYAINGGRYIVLGYDRNERIAEAITRLGYRFILMGGMFSYLFLTFLISMLVYSFSKRQGLYKTLFIGMSFFVIIAGGFRSWFIIFSIMLATYLSSIKSKFSFLIYALAFIFLVYSVLGSDFKSGPVGMAFQRAQGVFEIFEQDSDAATSIQNKSINHLPEQLNLIRQSPLTGWGFTENNGNADVGNFGLLVDVGILGFLIYLALWINIIRMYWRVIKNKKIDKSYRTAVKILMAGFIGLLISHFTTNQIFGISTFVVLISIFIFISDFVVKLAYSTMDSQNKDPVKK